VLIIVANHKRPISTTSDDTPPLKIVKRSARAKLFTAPTKGASIMDGANLSQSLSAVYIDDELNFLQQYLLHSVSPCSITMNSHNRQYAPIHYEQRITSFCFLQVKAKEQRTLDEKETCFADQVKRQKLIASLLSTFDVIFLFY
jgi:chromatin licensing and DNA replication factor 1